MNRFFHQNLAWLMETLQSKNTCIECEGFLMSLTSLIQKVIIVGFYTSELLKAVETSLKILHFVREPFSLFFSFQHYQTPNPLKKNCTIINNKQCAINYSETWNKRTLAGLTRETHLRVVTAEDRLCNLQDDSPSRNFSSLTFSGGYINTQVPK